MRRNPQRSKTMSAIRSLLIVGVRNALGLLELSRRTRFCGEFILLMNMVYRCWCIVVKSDWNLSNECGLES